MILLAVQAEVAVADAEGKCPAAAVAEEALREALACPPGGATKAYRAELLRLASGLDLQAASQVCSAAQAGRLSASPIVQPTHILLESTDFTTNPNANLRCQCCLKAEYIFQFVAVIRLGARSPCHVQPELCSAC